MIDCRSRNVASSSSCSRPVVDQLARRRMLAPWFCAQAAIGSPPFILPASDRNASCVAAQLARRRSRAGGRPAASIPSSSRSFCSNLSRPEPERRARLRRDLGFEILDVGADRLRRLDLRVGEVAEQMQIVDVGERARQILVDELQRAAHRLDADLDEDAGRLLDVVARRLNQARRLPQLREHAARALGAPARG